MNIDYFALFKFGLLVLAVLVLVQFLPAGLEAFRLMVPSARHTGEYNRAVFVILVIGTIGLIRLLKQGGPKA